MRRNVLETGDAVKTVFLSKAPPSYKTADLDRALEHHMRLMREELQKAGKLVVKTTKILWGEGDVRVIMRWEVLGTKDTKHVRRARAAESAKSRPIIVQEGASSDAMPF